MVVGIVVPKCQVRDERREGHYVVGDDSSGEIEHIYEKVLPQTAF